MGDTDSVTGHAPTPQFPSGSSSQVLPDYIEQAMAQLEPLVTKVEGLIASSALPTPPSFARLAGVELMSTPIPDAP